MAQALGLRATSLGASTALVALLVIGAVSIKTHVLPPFVPDAPGAIEGVILRPAEPPPTTPRRTEPRTQPQAQAPVVDDLPYAPLDETLTPIATLDAGGPSVIPGPITITSPQWTRRPSDLARYYPPRALARGIEGAVLLDCIVSVDGALRCTPVAENPQNWGFADAALRIAREHRMQPATRDGVPVEGRYRMRVPFDIN